MSTFVPNAKLVDTKRVSSPIVIHPFGSSGSFIEGRARRHKRLPMLVCLLSSDWAEMGHRRAVEGPGGRADKGVPGKD